MPLKHQREYRDPHLSRQLIQAINRTSTRPVKLMEVCGTHTMSAFRCGLHSLVPDNVTLLSGPGCPVCVTPLETIDRALAWLRRHQSGNGSFQWKTFYEQGIATIAAFALAGIWLSIGISGFKVVSMPAEKRMESK